MVLLTSILFLTLSYVVINGATASLIVELSDKFLEIHKEGQWLVMIYAPFSENYKRLEPSLSHVAQSLHATPVRVGRIDCTRFPNVAHNLEITGFPTILFLKGDQRFVYNGDLTKDEIVKFALRLSGPPVQEVTRTKSFNILKKIRDLYFLYVGEKSGLLWDTYNNVASVLQPHAFFYHSQSVVVDKHAPVEKTPALFVYKKNLHYNFTDFEKMDEDKLGNILYKWINAEHFSTFPKVTRDNINQLFLTKKYLVLAVVEENQLEEVPLDMLEFKDMVGSVIKKKHKKYHDHFQFGWVASPDLVNNIAMMVVSIPSLIVINSTTNYYYIPVDKPAKLTPHMIELFLENIISERVLKYDGNSYAFRIYWSCFVLLSDLASKCEGFSIFFLVLLSLSLGHLSFICYKIWCTDIFYADEKDQEFKRLGHAKQD